VTQNIITAKEIREGDKIRVTTVDGDRHNSFEGVANHYQRSAGTPNRRWFTAEDWTLWTGDESAVIELLDRPIPTVTVPDRKQAIVKYDVASFDPWKPERIAHRNGSGKWTAYDAKGERMDTHFTDEEFGRFLAAGAHKHEVVFAGVAE